MLLLDLERGPGCAAFATWEVGVHERKPGRKGGGGWALLRGVRTTRMLAGGTCGADMKKRPGWSRSPADVSGGSAYWRALRGGSVRGQVYRA